MNREHSRLQAAPLRAADFAGFGEVIEGPARSGDLVNAGTALRFDDVARLDLCAGRGRPQLSVFRAQPARLPLVVSAMERHLLSSQAFVPLGRHRFLVVVAPPGPAPESLRAFVTNGRQGVNYGRGVWHHPLIALDEESEFVAVGRAGPGEDCEILDLHGGAEVLVEFNGPQSEEK